MISTQLFQGERVHLAAIDFDKDPAVEAIWTRDPSYLHTLGTDPARPQSPAQIKKRYEAIEKEMEEGKNNFHFTIRSKEDSRLIGFARLQWIEWTHGSGHLRMAIGSPDDRGKGYGSETLALLLHFAFNELNLYRLTATLGSDNPLAIRFFQRAGFVEEVCRRKALLRQGQYFDIVMLGLLADEWRSVQAGR